MKNNRLSTRVLAVFAAVLLIIALSVPTFAATTYIFTPSDDNDFYSSPFAIPEGMYYVRVSIPTDSSGSEVFTTADPITVSYAPFSSEDVSFESVFLFEGMYKPYPDVEALRFALLGTPDYIDTHGYMLFANYADQNLKQLSATIEFIPVYEFPSLTDYITADTIPNVLNEIIALLPLALGVIVGYIAIRKGISYLQSFLHNS